ncbi:10833_t:CDS:2 [Cetraspora pellucida]|uniref:DNA 3'-5' helicase n=1 Tax=Cetraspora pellucida TaxID=1433469 RepID=A0A9N9GSU3_9GLOM|nr:10833_t:CDS:2 [Cetraspora pellucida]
MSNAVMRLTAEQRECVNFPLSQQVLIVNAGPGTGKTEIIKERMRFIVEQNLNQRQLILVLTFNRNISVDIWRKLKLIISKNAAFLQKNSQFSKRNNFLPCQIMNRTFHSLCHLIFSEEQEKISGKESFEIFFEEGTKEYFFPLLTDFATNFVEHTKDKKQSYSGKLTNGLRFRILNNLCKYVLNKKSNDVSVELRKKLIIERVLEESGRLDLYEPIKEFFISDQRKKFWLFFDDMVKNITIFLEKDEELKKSWQVFDHILVDESQDLDEFQLRMIKLLCLPHTTLTFVGDPKQTIYEFRGAKSGIFEAIKNLFPNNIQKNVTESFRSHQEIVAVANNFSQNQKQIDFVVEQIDQIREPVRKAILYRNNDSGKQIADELRNKSINFIHLRNKDDEGVEIIRKLKFLKAEEKAGEFVSVKDLLEKLNVSLIDPDMGDKLTPLQVRRFVWDLEELVFRSFLVNNSEDKIGKIILSTIHGSKGLEFDHVFLVDVNEEILPRKNTKNAEEELEEARIFYVGVTRAKKKLYLCSSDREKISQFLLKIDPKLVEIRASKVDFLKATSSLSAQKREEKIGEEGEEKVYDLLVESQIPFLKLNILKRVQEEPQNTKSHVYQALQAVEEVKMEKVSLQDLTCKEHFRNQDLTDHDLHVYQFFLHRFAAAGGKSGGEFYTPLRMLVQSKAFIQDIKKNGGEIFCLGQERIPDTLRLAKRQLILEGITSFRLEQGDTLFEDKFPDQQADFILANPPFNQAHNGMTEGDIRWQKYGFLIMANITLSSLNRRDVEMRQKWLNDNLVEAIITLPNKLFYTTSIAPCRETGKVLMIDVSQDDFGEKTSSKERKLNEEDIKRISEVYRTFWKSGELKKNNIPAVIVSREEIEKNNFVLAPSRYLPDEQEKLTPEEIDKQLLETTAELEALIKEQDKYHRELKNLLAEIKKELKND